MVQHMDMSYCRNNGSFLHDSLRTEGKAGGWLQTDRVQAIFYELLYYFGLIPEVMTDPFPTVAEL
jgi:hypothetical protein